MKKILVTGGAGYIGSHTVVELYKSGFEPVIVDNFSNSNKFILDRLEKLTGKKTKIYELDCTNKLDFEKVFEQEKDIFGVIHFAAYKAVGESVAQPTKYYHNNIGSLVVLLDLMKKYKVENLVFSSSCTVYGQPSLDKIPVDESSEIVPAESPYGYTKQVCEQLLRDVLKSDSNTIKSVLLRYFNPIGADDSGLIGEQPLGVPNNLVPYISMVADGKLDQLTVFGGDYNTKDGSCIRDYIHVTDLAIAHIKSIEWLQNQNDKITEVFNVGTGDGVSVLEAIHAFEKANGIKINYTVGNRRPGDIEQIFADNKKAKEVLNWSPKKTLVDAMSSVWKWQRNSQ